VTRIPQRGGAFRRWCFGGAVCSALLGVGCQGTEDSAPPPSASAAPLEFVDDGGSTLTLASSPTRMVSLIPAATQVLVALGEGHRLVGRSDYDLDAAALQVPSVGGGLLPSQEALLATSPDLVLRFEGESDRTTPGVLDAAGVAHFGLRLDTIGDVRRMVAHLSRMTKSEDIGSLLLARMDRDLEAVRTRLAGQARIRVAFLLDGDPPWVVGGGTFLHELIETAGGANVFADLGAHYRPVSVEEVLRRNPQALLIVEGGRIPSGLSHLPVHRLPSEVQLPGPRLAVSAVEIARLLFPDLGW
jgi:iron complex transport system substrate-binding protein